jgi:hypothetical protein
MYRGEYLDLRKQETNRERYTMMDITCGTHWTNNAYSILFGKQRGEREYLG